MGLKVSLFSPLYFQMFRYTLYCYFSQYTEIKPVNTQFEMMMMMICIYPNQDNMLIAQDEIFGPVQTILKFK